MGIRKILEKEMSKSSGRAELVKVPPERRQQKVAGQTKPGCGRAGENDGESGGEVMR